MPQTNKQLQLTTTQPKALSCLAYTNTKQKILFFSSIKKFDTLQLGTYNQQNKKTNKVSKRSKRKRNENQQMIFLFFLVLSSIIFNSCQNLCSVMFIPNLQLLFLTYEVLFQLVWGGDIWYP